MVALDDATLYTIEGVAAALLMIATVTVVMQAISVYTPGDTHIDDMLLEQLGADALTVMDLPGDPGGLDRTELEDIILTWDQDRFHGRLYPLLRTRSLSSDDPVQYSASISYRVGDDVYAIPFRESARFTGRDPAVRVTRWVQVSVAEGHPLRIATTPAREGVQAVLLEVILWRG